MTRTLLLLVLTTLCDFAGAATPDANLIAALKGRWEGVLTGAFRSQEVSWHFDVTESGELRGYMGPSFAGMPSLRMQNLVIDGNAVSFTLDSQHAAFTGSITPDGIVGSWQQGQPLQLQMKKKDFVFPLSEKIHAALLGRWDMDNPLNAAIWLEFADAGDGRLSGTLSMPSSNLHDIPLVDIFVTEEGFAQIATDNGRRFSGRLINGVLVGEYVSGTRNYRRSFVREGQRARGFDLDLSETAWDLLAGRWNAEIIGDDVVLEFYRTEDNAMRGRLLFSEGPTRSDELLEVTVDGENFTYATYGGRTFVGTLSEEGLAGEYRVNVRPFDMRFTRATSITPN
jgi:hypothetical protein